MKVLGFRFSINEIDYAALEGTRSKPVLKNKGIEKSPKKKNYKRSEILNWYYSKFKEIIGNIKPDFIIYKDLDSQYVGIKDIQRCEIAGVLFLAAIHYDDKYKTIYGIKTSQIKASLNYRRKLQLFSDLFKGSPVEKELPKSRNLQEAIACALCVLK